MCAMCLINTILTKAHSSIYSIYPIAARMYQNLRQYNWWDQMKWDMVEFISQYLNCQEVKYEHQRPEGILQRMPILE